MIAKKLKIMAVAVLATMGLTGASANPILTDLPSSVYITVGDLEWTWAAPVSSVDWFGLNTLSAPDLHPGWRYATEAEFAARPDASAFLGPDGVIQSAIYWNTTFDYVDYGDGAGGFIHRTLDAANDPYEIWYVRGGAVPEPATWALMLLGFGAVGVAVRRSPRTAVA